ncbi:MAG: nuclear transport factor 2 family protein [Leptospirillum sp.]|jgi:hypothetical protein
MQNLNIVRNLYGAFAARDQKAILEIFDPNIVWIQNKGFPGGGTHIGAETVLKDVFEPFRIEWDSWKAIVSHYLDAGEAVVAIGEYCGVNKTTGKSMKAAFAHVYWVRDSRIIRFQQYTDTLMVVQAMRHDPV